MEYRQLFKNNKTLMYQLIYKEKIKNITAKVDKNNKIVVSCPKFITPKEADAFVMKYFDKFHDYITQRTEHSLVNLEQNKISIKGISYEIKIQIINSGKQKYEIIGNKIYLFLKDEEKKQNLIEKMLHDLGHDYLVKRTFQYAKKLNLALNEVNTKWYQSKWGQCEHYSKKITLAIQLYMFHETMIDYVIIHELCHLIYPNHSPEFWNLVEKLYPNYKIVKQKLKYEC